MTQLDYRLNMAKFFHWWVGELRSLIPLSWRGEGGLGNRELIQIHLPHVTLFELREGELRQLGSIQINSQDAEAQKIAFQALLSRHGKGGTRWLSLYLAAQQVLRKTISLPAAAEENLAQVLTFELDRHTPFKPDQVYLSYKCLARDPHTNTLTVEVAVVPREVVNQALALTNAWDAGLDAVLVEGDLFHPAPHFNLLPELSRPPENSLWRIGNIALMTLAALLLTAALAMPLWQKRQHVIALFPEVNKVKIAAQNADVSHKELDQSVARYNYLRDKKRAAPPVTILLNEVTQLLPDDTWVQQFELKGRELQLVGETSSSSKLIGMLEQSELLNEANFRSPLTKVQPGNAERFHLVAEVQPLPVSKLAALILAAQTRPKQVTPVAPKVSNAPTPTLPGSPTAVVPESGKIAKPSAAPLIPPAAPVDARPQKPGLAQPSAPGVLPPIRPYSNLPPGPPPVPGTYPAHLAPTAPVTPLIGSQVRPSANPTQGTPPLPPTNGAPAIPPGYTP